jgi:hypothetical protein
MVGGLSQRDDNQECVVACDTQDKLGDLSAVPPKSGGGSCNPPSYERHKMADYVAPIRPAGYAHYRQASRRRVSQRQSGVASGRGSASSFLQGSDVGMAETAAMKWWITRS